MRSLKTAVVAVLSIVGLVGCGGSDAKIYRVFVDEASIDRTALPKECFNTGAQPVGFKNTSTAYRSEQQWTVWQGKDKTQWLDMSAVGGVSYKLGDTTTIVVAGPIEGQDKVFTGTNEDKVTPTANSTVDSTDTQSITVTFDTLDSLASGSITLLSKYTVNDPNSTKPATCTGTLPFSGRLISGSQQINTNL